VLLIVPAPIKQAYIWDLIPSFSAVRRCMDGGFRLYLIRWEPPGMREQDVGLADYADRVILGCLNAIEAVTGQRTAFLAGHSLGGTLAAIFAALHPERVSGLVLLEAPLSFSAGTNAFDPLIHAIGNVVILTNRVGNIPGTLLDIIAVTASPTTFVWGRYLDYLTSILDAECLQTHLLVERWLLDEMPLARRFFEEIVEWLYRDDCFMQRRLTIAGRAARPEHIDAPIVSVAEPASRIVPAASILPFHDAVGSDDTVVFWYGGDRGVSLQHVGPLVGRRAHQHLWPRILSWLGERAAR
jgi:polyhydroxyalkanoate synthase